MGRLISFCSFSIIVPNSIASGVCYLIFSATQFDGNEKKKPPTSTDNILDGMLTWQAVGMNTYPNRQVIYMQNIFDDIYFCFVIFPFSSSTERSLVRLF